MESGGVILIVIDILLYHSWNHKMPLHKLADYDPNYKETFGNDDVKGLELYTEGQQKIGTVVDALVENEGRFRYLVIETHNKQILLPIGLAKIDYNRHRVYVDGLSQAQVEQLPEYSDRYTVDYDYEEQVRNVYRPMMGTHTTSAEAYNRDTYNYKRDSSLYDLSQPENQTLKLYEERLIASKRRLKTGEVSVGKHIETETVRVSVPVAKERVAIERVYPTEVNAVVSPEEATFEAGEVARIEIYEETPEIHKEAFVREEVRLKKVLDQSTVEVEETVRHEKLDVDADGRSLLQNSEQNPTNSL
jgi:uncharacterized protein (TIGR02271 family)